MSQEATGGSGLINPEQRPAGGLGNSARSGVRKACKRLRKSSEARERGFLFHPEDSHSAQSRLRRSAGVQAWALGRAWTLSALVNLLQGWLNCIYKFQHQGNPENITTAGQRMDFPLLSTCRTRPINLEFSHQFSHPQTNWQP